MGVDNNKNEQKKDLNIDDLIKDLNSLLEKIPEMIESASSKDISNQPKEDEKTQELTATQQSFSDDKETTNNNLLQKEIPPQEEDVSNQSNIEELIINPPDEGGAKEIEEPQNLEKNDDYNEEVELAIESEDVLEEKDELLDKEIELELDIDIEKEDGIVEKEDIVKESIDTKEVYEKEIEFELNSENAREIEDIKIESSILQAEPSKSFDEINTFVTISDQTKRLLRVGEKSTIPQERTRRIGIIYALSDERLLVDFIKKLDEISSASAEKPMFVERSFFMVYDENFSTETLLVNSQNANINAVVCIGELPLDKMYEIENSVLQAGYLFLVVKRNSFSDTLVIDFLCDLISV